MSRTGAKHLRGETRFTLEPTSETRRRLARHAARAGDMPLDSGTPHPWGLSMLGASSRVAQVVLALAAVAVATALHGAPMVALFALCALWLGGVARVALARWGAP